MFWGDKHIRVFGSSAAKVLAYLAEFQRTLPVALSGPKLKMKNVGLFLRM